MTLRERPEQHRYTGQREDKGGPAQYICERCGRPVGAELLNCLERQQGHCPYARREPNPWARVGAALLALLSLIGLTFVLTGAVADSGGAWAGILVLVFLYALVGFFSGTFFALPRRIEIRHLNTGLKWEQNTLLGIVLKRILTTNPEPLPIDLALSRPLACPPNVTRFPRVSAVWSRTRGVAKSLDKRQLSSRAERSAVEGPLATSKRFLDWLRSLEMTGLCVSPGSRTTAEDAIAAFRAAFLGLLAQGLIRVYRCHRYEALLREGFEWARSIYMIAPTEHTLVASIDGALESKMLAVLQSWARAGQLVLSPEESTVYQLVRAVYEIDVRDPAQWAADLVVKDALHGWARSVIARRKRPEAEAIHPERLRSEKDAVDELSRQLDERHPGFSRDLDAQIARAIRSREWQPDDFFVP